MPSSMLTNTYSGRKLCTTSLNTPGQIRSVRVEGERTSRSSPVDPRHRHWLRPTCCPVPPRARNRQHERARETDTGEVLHTFAARTGRRGESICPAVGGDYEPPEDLIRCRLQSLMLQDKANSPANRALTGVRVSGPVMISFCQQCARPLSPTMLSNSGAQFRTGPQ